MEYNEMLTWVGPPTIGCIGLWFAMVRQRARKEELARCILIPGVVESLEPSEDDGSETTYTPWIVVYPPDQGHQRFRAEVGSDPPDFAVGQEVEVYYNPQGEPKFMLRSWFEQWGVVAVLYLFGFGGILTPLIWEWLFPLIQSSLRK